MANVTGSPKGCFVFAALSAAFAIAIGVSVAFSQYAEKKRDAIGVISSRLVGEPCKVDELTAEEVKLITEDDQEAYATAKSRCRQQRRCAEIVTGAGDGKLNAQVQADVAQHMPLVVRVVGRSLEPGDLRSKPEDMPCGHLSELNRDTMWRAFVRAAAASANAWMGEVSASSDLVEALSRQGGLEADGRKVLAERAESTAKEAVAKAKESSNLGHALDACQLAEKLGAETGKYCKAAGRRAEVLKKREAATDARQEAAERASQAREDACMTRCDPLMLTNPDAHERCMDRCLPKLFDDEAPFP